MYFGQRAFFFFLGLMAFDIYSKSVDCRLAFFFFFFLGLLG